MAGSSSWLADLLKQRQEQGKTSQQLLTSCTPVIKCSVCDTLVSELAPNHSWCQSCADSFNRIDFTA